MLRRVLVAGVAIPAALGFVYAGGWVLTALVALFGALGAQEVYRLAQQGGVRPIVGLGIVAAALLPVVAFVTSPIGPSTAPAVVLFGAAGWLVAVMGAVMAWRAPGDRPLTAMAVTVFGALYAGGLPAFLLIIRHGAGDLPRWTGTWLVFLPLVIVWVCDTLAMFGGRLIGGRKLAPVLSPNKTWAGAISGSLGGALVGPLFGYLALSSLAISWWQLAVFGLIVSLMGQIGDVAESLLKREVGVKDSGAFFPGHGGVLDRFDSLYWALPTAALLLHAFGVL